MRKNSLFRIFCFILFCASASQGFAEELSFITVAQAQILSPNTQLTLRGNIILGIGDDRYIFRDYSGEIIITIERDGWGGLYISQSDRIEIDGELKEDNENVLFIEVKNIRRVPSSGAVPVSMAIYALNQPLTREYIARYSRPQNMRLLLAAMQRGSLYHTFIKDEVERRGLPIELVFLPVIESNYMPGAVSRAGATGLWQFMMNSIGPYDMAVTEWKDERMDFWKSTMAALSKLQDNYRYFNDWALALAAYNAGLGRIRRALQQSGSTTYWELAEKRAIPAETIHYVPKLLAVAHILTNPRSFGIEPFWYVDHQWTRIRVGRMVNIEMLADAAGVDRQALIWANHELLHRITPPDPNYHLKVRGVDAPAIIAVLEQDDVDLLPAYRTP